MSAPKLCLQCHTLAAPRVSRRVPTYLIWAALALVGVVAVGWPAALVALACVGAALGAPRVCPRCASRDVIPADTPRAARLLLGPPA